MTLLEAKIANTEASSVKYNIVCLCVLYATHIYPHSRTQCVQVKYFAMYIYDIVEAHCYFVDIGRIDREQIRSRINNNDCRTFRPRRPLSTAYRTLLYAVDKGLRGRNVLQSLLLILLRICSRSIRPICIYIFIYINTKSKNCLLCHTAMPVSLRLTISSVLYLILPGP